MITEFSLGDLLLGPNRGNKNTDELGKMFSTELDKSQTLFNKSGVDINSVYPAEVPDLVQGAGNYLSSVDYTSPEIKKAGVAPRVVKQTNTQDTNDTQLAQELIQAVANPQSGVGSVKLPSGLEVTGITPDKLQVSGDRRGVDRNAPQLIGTQEIPKEMPVQEDKSLLQKIGGVIGDPRVGFILGELGKAVNTNVYGTKNVGYLLGDVGSQLAQRKAYGRYLADIEAGNSVGGYANILSPEQKAAAEERVLAERKLALDEANAGVQRDLIKAQTEGMLTAEEKKRIEEQKLQTSKEIATEKNLTAKEINDARIAAQLKIGMNKNNWMAMGKEHNYVFNWKTGDIRKIAPTEGSGGIGASAIGNLNSAMYSKFEEAATAEFLPQIFEKYRKKWEEKGWTSLVELRNAITNKQTGAVNWELVMPDLSPDDRAKFGQRLAEYTAAHLKGIPYTVEFADIMSKKAQEQELPKPANVAQEDWDAATYEQKKEFLQQQGLIK